MTLRTAIIDAMRDNVGDEFTAREISDAVALTDNLSPYLDHANPVQIGAVLRAMCDDGLAKKRRHHEGTLYQLMPAALDWVPPAYDWRKYKTVVNQELTGAEPAKVVTESIAPVAIGTDPLPLPAVSYEDERPTIPCANHHFASQEVDDDMTLASLRRDMDVLTAERDQTRAQLDNAMMALTQAEAERFHLRQELDRAQYIVEKQRRGLPTLPPAWMGKLRLTMASYAEGEDRLRIDVDNEGNGAYASIKADLITDPGDMDWLPRLSDGLIALFENLFPHLTIRQDETISQASPNVPVIGH
jgi:hypothetical protein